MSWATSHPTSRGRIPTTDGCSLTTSASCSITGFLGRKRTDYEIFRRGCHRRRQAHHDAADRRTVERERSRPYRYETLYRNLRIGIHIMKSYGFIPQPVSFFRFYKIEKINKR